jgi:voltage-gated potassium channel
LKSIVLSFAYFLAGNIKYLKIKSYIKGILGDSSSIDKKIFDIFMIFLVLSTVAILIYEIKHEISPIFDIFELVAIIIFIIEWLCRLWVSSDIHQTIINDHEKSQKYSQQFFLKESFKKVLKDKFAFIFSPLSLIDLMAILPSYRPLRVLRIFLLFRLFKVLRYTKSVTQFTSVLYEKRFEFLTLGFLVSFVIFFASTVMYIYEGLGNNPNINSYFDSIYWSFITLSTVGYGDITPVTVEGKFATLVLVVSGFGVLGFTTSIIATAFSEKLEVLKLQKVVTEANKFKDLIIICGFGRMGSTLAGEFKKEGINFAIIDIDPKEVLDAKEKGYLAIEADATNMEKLKEFNDLKNVSTIIALTSDDAINLSIVLSSKAISPDINTIARANDKTSKKKLLLGGANQVFFSYEISAYMAVGHIEQPVAIDAIDKMSLSTDGSSIEELEVTKESHLVGLSLKSLDLHSKNINLIGVKEKKGDEESFIFNPDIESYHIKVGDSLVLIGWKDDISMLMYKVAK